MSNRPSVTLELDPSLAVALRRDERHFVSVPDVVYVVHYGRDGNPDQVTIFIPDGDLELRATGH